MALSGSFIIPRTSGTQYLQGRIEWTATQSAVNNTSTVNAKMIFKRTNTGYTTYGTGTFNMNVNGTAYTTGSIAYSFGSSDTVVLNKTLTIAHNANGTKSFTISASYSGDSPIGGNGSQSFTLNTIDRNAPTVTFSVSDVTSNSFKISATATYSCNIWQYKIDSGSWTTFSTASSTTANKSITGLSPSTTYSVTVRARRTHNNIYGTSSAKSIKTIGNSVINSAEAFQADSSSPLFRLNITNYVQTYTHSLEVYSGASMLAKFENLSFSKGTNNVDIQPTATQINAVLLAMKNNASLDITYKLYSYENEVQIGNVSEKVGTAQTSSSISSPTLSSTSFSYEDSNSITAEITGNNQYLIQGYSTLSVTCPTATAKNQADISKYFVTVGNTTIESDTSTINFGIIGTSGAITVIVGAKDTRGYTSTITGIVNVISYSQVQIKELIFGRVNNYETFCNLDISGSFSPISVLGVDKNTIQSMQYRKKSASDSEWGEWTNITPTISGSGFSYLSNSFESISSDSSWSFEFRVNDKLTSDTESASVEQGVPLISLRKGKMGVNNPNPAYAIDATGDINASENLRINGNAIADFIVEQGTSGNWTWRKWASGRAECHGVFSLALTNNNIWVSPWYYVDLGAVNYPTGLFTAVPELWFVPAAYRGLEIVTHGATAGTKDKTPTLRMVRPASFASSGTVANKSIAFRAVGRWK